MNEDGATPGPDQVVAYGTHPDQLVELWDAAGDAAVVLVHGGFWRPRYDRAHLRPLAGALAATGRGVASVEYRRTPGRPDDTVGDVATGLGAAAAALGDRRLVVVGHSGGGHLSLWAAAAAPVPEVVGTLALAPVADLGLAHRRDLGSGAVAAFLGGPPDRRPDLDPARLPSPAAPVVILQGDGDRDVPAEVARSYRDAHPHVRLVELPRTGHFDVIDPRSAVWPVLLEHLGCLERSAPA